MSNIIQQEYFLGNESNKTRHIEIINNKAKGVETVTANRDVDNTIV